MRASVKYRVIYRHREKYGIREMRCFFGVSRSGYYDYVKRMNAPAKDLPLAERIRECQTKCRNTYGYRRVHIWLEKRIDDYIFFYNNQRIQTKTKLTPLELRRQFVA